MTRQFIKLHNAIQDVLTASGFKVQTLYGYCGLPPILLVGAKGHNFIFMVKAKGSQPKRLTQKEGDWLTQWKGQAEVVSTPFAALQIINRRFYDGAQLIDCAPLVRGGDAARTSQII
jgi:hypothetical protein